MPPDRATAMTLLLFTAIPLVALALGSLVLLGLPDLDPTRDDGPRGRRWTA